MLTKEELGIYFYYDETSPSCLCWAKDVYSKGRKNVSKGDAVGSWSPSSGTPSSGAWITSLNKRRLKVHRIIYQLFYGDLTEDFVIDHINGDPGDNKINNLRKVSHKVNMRNVKKRKDNTTGVSGVEYYNREGRSSYFTASWKNLEGKKESKSFSTGRHGKEGSFIKAIEARTKAIKNLNKMGAGYSDTHNIR